MNTEQQLRERAEAISAKHFANYLTEKIGTYHDPKDIVPASYQIDTMIDFHKQELQRIGEVVYVPVSEEEVEEAEWNEIKAQRLGWFSSPYGWLKKLSLLEVMDVTGDKNVK